MIEFQPQSKKKLLMLEKFVDADGKTTLNPQEYKQYRKDMAK
jgi:ribosomal protein L29